MQRSVDEFCFGEVVDHRRTVLCAVAAPGNPADQIIPVGRREWQNFYELHPGFARQFHQHEVRLHRLGLLLAPFAHTDFGGDGPEILTVVERCWVRHVIEAVHLGLQFQQQLGVAHVITQTGRHRGCILKQARKNTAVARDNRVLRVKHVKGGRTAVGVDYSLYAVSHVVNGIAVETVMARVRIVVGNRKRVHDPREPAVVAEHDVRIRIVGEERRERRYAVAHVAMH